MRELLRNPASRGVSWGTLKWILGVVASVAIGYAAFLVGQGAQAQEIRDHDRRIVSLEEWQIKSVEANHEFQMQTTKSLSRIESKLEDIKRR